MTNVKNSAVVRYLGAPGALIRGVGSLAADSFRVSQSVIPITKLLLQKEKVTVEQLSDALNDLFRALYAHPLTTQGRRVTNFLRRKSLIPNEQTTEKLIRFIVDQVILRSPMPIPKPIIDEFWNFFNELFKEPELKGLVELNLDFFRVLLKAYEPLLVNIINLVKETGRANHLLWEELIKQVSVIRGDLLIIRRQIKALRHIKPFFQTDPRDFATQAQIVACMIREFGPFFIKLAQVAAANADFLPHEISQELLVFQEDVPPMQAGEVIQAFEECFGKKPWECYFDFNIHAPIKSGSIGSVYLAKKPMMRHGQEILVPVIVKIARFGLDREFLMGKTVLGLAILSSNYWAPHSKIAPFLEAMQKQIDEFFVGFQQELDLETEARTQRRFCKRSKYSSVWKAPEVYFSSPRILEMEYIRNGVNIIAALDILPQGKRSLFGREIASRFMYTILFHLFMFQELHGDLHPGNVMLGPDRQLYLVDWGNCINMAGKWKPLWDYLAGALSADANLLAEALINMSADPDAHRRRLKEIRFSLEDTFRKKQVAPLNRYFLFQLQLEGVNGLHRRFQVVLHLISNAQQLGLTVESEYLHLSRSIAALIGTYTRLYEGLPKMMPIFDFFKILSQFPYTMIKDRLEVKRALIYQSVIGKINWMFRYLNPEPLQRH